MAVSRRIISHGSTALRQYRVGAWAMGVPGLDAAHVAFVRKLGRRQHLSSPRSPSTSPLHTANRRSVPVHSTIPYLSTARRVAPYASSAPFNA
eukprot:3941938-Rhodomonas_salina.3